ncbi:MAG: ANTAR domain-containing protein [Lapillicoccus sp.]
MAVQPSDDERQWAADKRDFVADRRDELAARRDAADDARDLTADARQSLLDERHDQQEARAAELELPLDGAAVAQEVARRHADEEADENREQRRTERTLAGRARDEATARRLEATPATGLASAFAAIAGYLYAADSFDGVLERIAETAVNTVAGCQMASVTLSAHGAHETAATTDPAASAVDRAQYDTEEGPCLDAVEVPIVYARSFPDPRWPALGSRPTHLGAHSAASFSLATATDASAGIAGSLNTYGAQPDAYSDEAQQIGLILAAHAATAAGAVRERDALKTLAETLNQALLSRDVIGQAKGILMERLKVTPEDAFDLLRTASNRLNQKLHLVAATLTETGALAPPR